jgi:RNA polymerase sigma-70 factor (ECF subfamily)
MTSFVSALTVEHASRLPMTEPAFQEFYARTAGPLLGYLTRLLGERAGAEDLLQEAYLRFLSAARVPEADDHRRHYLFRIATNLARDLFRRRKTVTFVPLGDHDGGSVDPATDASEMWSALARVTPRDRELLLLAYVEGFSHAEIAQITGLMRASLKPLLFRARKRLARALGAAEASTPGALGVAL